MRATEARLAHAFHQPEHQPFLWAGGAPAALLIHGFPGTPAELRPLATSLHQAGWTVQGLLLPGFGPQIERLFTCTHGDWAEAVAEAAAALRRDHSPLVLIGHSMGGALALAEAARAPVDGLVLLAPFWRLGNRSQWLLWPLIKRIIPELRPFAWLKIDFNDAKTRQDISNFLPGVDLDDPTMQQAIRELRIPARMVDQVRAVGDVAWRQASRAHAPLLVIQGTRDEVVQVEHTRRLLQRLPGPLRYMEVDAGHDLLTPQQAAWPQIEGAVREFLSALACERGHHP